MSSRSRRDPREVFFNVSNQLANASISPSYLRFFSYAIVLNTVHAERQEVTFVFGFIGSPVDMHVTPDTLMPFGADQDCSPGRRVTITRCFIYHITDHRT